jgi:diguanylate cyclase (GGDEF)-like protein
MASAVRRQKLGDRMIVMIGAVVIAAVVALVGFAFLVARHVDATSAEREMRVARGEFIELAERMKADLAAFTRWDEVIERTAQSGDTEWMHRYLGLRLHRASGHHRTYVLNHADQPIYAARNGDLVAPGAFRAVHETLAPLIHAVRHAHAIDFAFRMSSTDSTRAPAQFEPPPEATLEVVFRRLEGRPAMLGVMTIIPAAATADSKLHSPPVAVSAAFLGGDLLAKLAKELGTDNLTVSEERPSAEQLALPVPLSSTEAPAWMTWTPRRPGSVMLQRLLPALGSVVALLIAISALILLYVRRTAERLDHSERRATELAYRDRLTGLANRVQLLDVLSERLQHVSASQRIALVLIDLDDFKDINDTLGHPTGDEVLFAMGERLSAIGGSTGLTVRFGGDEFALLMPVSADNDEVFAICHRVSDAVRTHVAAGEQFLNVSATVGVAVAPEDGTDAEQLMRRAEIALYRAKDEARGGYRVFDPSYEEVLHKRSAIERELQRALTNEELAVKFQPLFAADGERIVGVEALVRWNHPERGVVPPSEFIPVAEQTGLVTKLDEWVLRRACEYASRWPGLSLAVNLSASNFRQPHVAERLTRVLVDTGFDPRRLEIEITESMLLGASGEVLGELSEMRRLGIRIALDDFGTGFSSLGYLRRFPVDKLKIDKSFVQNLGITEDAAAIVECVTRLGRALGLAVTAEGVENAEQHRFVRAVGCHQVQGYLFSPPVEPERIDEMIPRDRPMQARTPKQRFATV